MKKMTRKDLDGYVSADLGHTVGNGEHWQSRYEGEDLLFIEFSDGGFGDITANFCKLAWDESADDFADECETLDSENLGEWNSDDFESKAYAFAEKCGF